MKNYSEKVELSKITVKDLLNNQKAMDEQVSKSQEIIYSFKNKKSSS